MTVYDDYDIGDRVEWTERNNHGLGTIKGIEHAKGIYVSWDGETYGQWILKMLFEKHAIVNWHIRLIDDGTLDTVLRATHVDDPSIHYDCRFSQEHAADYRLDNGDLSDDGMDELSRDTLDMANEWYATERETDAR